MAKRGESRTTFPEKGTGSYRNYRFRELIEMLRCSDPSPSLLLIREIVETVFFPHPLDSMLSHRGTGLSGNKEARCATENEERVELQQRSPFPRIGWLGEDRNRRADVQGRVALAARWKESRANHSSGSVIST